MVPSEFWVNLFLRWTFMMSITIQWTKWRRSAKTRASTWTWSRSVPKSNFRTWSMNFPLSKWPVWSGAKEICKLITKTMKKAKKNDPGAAPSHRVNSSSNTRSTTERNFCTFDPLVRPKKHFSFYHSRHKFSHLV